MTQPRNSSLGHAPDNKLQNPELGTSFYKSNQVPETSKKQDNEPTIPLPNKTDRSKGKNRPRISIYIRKGDADRPFGVRERRRGKICL